MQAENRRLFYYTQNMDRSAIEKDHEMQGDFSDTERSSDNGNSYVPSFQQYMYLNITWSTSKLQPSDFIELEKDFLLLFWS